MKQINQRGFSTMELVFALVLVAILTTVGWTVYQRQVDNQKPARTAAPTVQYQNADDSTKTFAYSLPSNWEEDPYVWEDCCGPVDPEPDWSKESKPITLHPKNDKNVTITIKRFPYDKTDDWTSYEALKAKVKEDYFAKVLFEGKRPDNHQALFTKVDYLGPPDAKVESFTDHRYYYDEGKSVVMIEFREKYHHDWPGSAPDINNTKYLSDFKHIASSVKFAK